MEESIHIEACSATAIELEAGDELVIVDPLGKQVADLFAFNRHDLTESLSNGRTFDTLGTLRLTEGHGLYSTKNRVMLTIVDDPVGRHDFLYTPCSREMFAAQYDLPDRTGCLEHLAAALEPHGVKAEQISIPFNIFMNVEIDGATGALEVLPPISEPGSHITFRAEMDLLVGVAACSTLKANAGEPGPIEVRIRC